MLIFYWLRGRRNQHIFIETLSPQRSGYYMLIEALLMYIYAVYYYYLRIILLIIVFNMSVAELRQS